ncbi:hemerythrin domain-containing protein [Streptomyces sp. ISL-43]|uniref:hemerythrin domain-containing protein n=1 Tax=Streptomyces sp. ISL-43 TaxID=2819183 RepID=UPI001BE68CB8|nr:hemerythrin domain-containing protein [Streptomyces sp. ISL-43]MBT2447765.1 hemerythrin domain-containing protein [Streptomyces sp. ISL-43]
MSDEVGLTAMYAMHDALRRELAHLDRITIGTDRDPRQLPTTAGWTLFKKALHAHHTAEDDALWPALRRRLAGRPKDLALLEAMEAEHAAIDPLIEAIDAALADPEVDQLRLGILTDALATGLAGHLKHEEDAALPLIRRALTAEQWNHFGQVHAQLIGPDAPLLLPWLLDGADEATVEKLLAPLPASARAAYTAEWAPAYTALDRWRPGTAPTR